MPTVVGLTRSAAESAVQEANLAVAKVRPKYSETVGDGRGTRLVGEAGASLKRDTPVDLVVSRGPAPIRIKNYAAAVHRRGRRRCQQGRVPVVVTTAHSDQIAKGLVIMQNPSIGPGHEGRQSHRHPSHLARFW